MGQCELQHHLKNNSEAIDPRLHTSRLVVPRLPITFSLRWQIFAFEKSESGDLAQFHDVLRLPDLG